MHFYCYVVLVFCFGCCVKSESKSAIESTKELSKAAASPGQRQFGSYLKKWILGRDEEKQTTKMTRTQIKYLPIYVPVPIYGDQNGPPNDEYYGAHSQPERIDDIETNLKVPKKPTLPYPHSQTYGLPYGNQLFHVVNRYYRPSYGEFLTKPARGDYPESFYSPTQDDLGYEMAFDDPYSLLSIENTGPSDSEGVVIDNPELITDPDKNPDRGEQSYLRKRRKHKKRIQADDSL